MKKHILGLAITAACALPAAAQQSVEVLHWWTAGGEAAALNVLKGNLEKQGVKWNDMPVAGGGGGGGGGRGRRAERSQGQPGKARRQVERHAGGRRRR